MRAVSKAAKLAGQGPPWCRVTHPHRVVPSSDPLQTPPIDASNASGRPSFRSKSADEVGAGGIAPVNRGVGTRTGAALGRTFVLEGFSCRAPWAARFRNSHGRGVGTMGKMLYGSPSMEVDFDDRALMHLQIVMTAKLRRGESFVFTWRDSTEQGEGRSSIWMHSNIPLLFRYFGSRVPVINREWIEALSLSANSAGGLHFSEEPPTVGPVAPAR